MYVGFVRCFDSYVCGFVWIVDWVVLFKWLCGFVVVLGGFICLFDVLIVLRYGWRNCGIYGGVGLL